MTSNTAKVYPVGAEANDAVEPKLGVCLSGGGSRALTAGLGALSGLTSTDDPTDSSKKLMDHVSYLSSVSGGTWCATLYTFTPTQVDGREVTDEELLITPQQPADLIHAGRHVAEPRNVNHLDELCIGTAPQQFSLLGIVEFLRKLHHWRLFRNKAKWRWFWISAVGEIILRRFGLYSAMYPQDSDVLMPTKFFSQSDDYVTQNITPENPALTPMDFHTVRPNRKPLYINFNVLEDFDMEKPVQIPVQATPEHTGALGQSPDGSLHGGGDVESFGFGSTLEGPGGQPNTAAIERNRRYALCDAAGSSSAFFAEALLSFANSKLEEIKGLIAGNMITRFIFRRLLGDIEHFVGQSKAAELIPQYNYWPVGSVQSPMNQNRGFSDGGNFDNTGILGLLARTDANRVVAFVNSASAMTQDANGTIGLAGQIPQLFGYQPAMQGGKYVKWPGGMSPAEPLSYIQVFSDEGGKLQELLQGLVARSRDGGAIATKTAAFTQDLVTIDNPVAHIKGGRHVRVLWVYNNRVNAWQDQITDSRIQELLKEGQGNQNSDGSPSSGHADGDLAHFPWYKTATQIHLPREAVNMLAQLSAWNVEQLAQDVSDLMKP